MGLETGTFVEDLVATNPPGGDLKSQGDDHLRLIKTVLRNTFKRATKAFYLPVQSSKVASFSPATTDDNTVYSIDTTGPGFIEIFLPSTLTTADAGWSFQIIKTDATPNVIFLEPASGTINGFEYIRRSVAYIPIKVLWTGSTWTATRAFGVPIGSIIPFFGSTLPQGCLWADGASFDPGSSKELSIVYGGTTKPDLRGRAVYGRDNMGVGAANRVTSGGSGINGASLGATGGNELHTLTLGQIPSHNHGVTDPTHNHGVSDPGHHHGSPSLNDPGHGHGTSESSHSHPNDVWNANGGAGIGYTGQGASKGADANTKGATTGLSINSNTTGISLGTNTADATTGITNVAASTGISIQNSGSGAAHNNMAPTIICNYVVVAE